MEYNRNVCVGILSFQTIEKNSHPYKGMWTLILGVKCALTLLGFLPN